MWKLEIEMDRGDFDREGGVLVSDMGPYDSADECLAAGRAEFQAEIQDGYKIRATRG